MDLPQYDISLPDVRIGLIYGLLAGIPRDVSNGSLRIPVGVDDTTMKYDEIINLYFKMEDACKRT